MRIYYHELTRDSCLSGGDEPEIGIGHCQGIVFTTPGLNKGKLQTGAILGGNRGMIRLGART